MEDAETNGICYQNCSYRSDDCFVHGQQSGSVVVDEKYNHGTNKAKEKIENGHGPIGQSLSPEIPVERPINKIHVLSRITLL